MTLNGVIYDIDFLSYWRFVLDIIGCHVGVQVVPMIVIYQEKILLTLFDLKDLLSWSSGWK